MKNYVLIFCLLSLVAKSQTWQKIGSFVDYWNQSPALEASTSFDFNSYSNKLYSTYINSLNELTVMEYNGNSWNNISPTPKINLQNSAIPKMNLKCGKNNNNIYLLLCDSFLVYNGSNWQGYILPHTNTNAVTTEFEIAINPTNNDTYVAREINVGNVGAVLRLDKITGNTWNFIDEIILNTTSHTYGNGDGVSFMFKPNGEATIAVATNDVNANFNIYNLISGNLNQITHSAYQVSSYINSFHLFYNPSSGNINLITDESNIYEIGNVSATLLHSFSSPFYVPSAFISASSEQYIFSANASSHEINTYDANYNLTPKDDNGFNLIEQVLFTNDNVNNGIYVMGFNIDSTNVNFPFVELAVYKIDNTTSIKESSNTYSISIFPNPAKNTLHIKTKQKTDLNYSIINTMGQTIKTGNLKNEFEINISDMDNGFYFISLYEGVSKIYTTKFIIE